MFSWLFKKKPTPAPKPEHPGLVHGRRVADAISHKVLNSAAFRRLVLDEIYKSGYSETPTDENNVGFIWCDETENYAYVLRKCDE